MERKQTSRKNFHNLNEEDNRHDQAKLLGDDDCERWEKTMNENVDFAELAQYAKQLGYRDRELIANRLARMVVRDYAYLNRRRSRGTHTSHDDTTAEDMAVIALTIKLLHGEEHL
jgi:hypothetical protein